MPGPASTPTPTPQDPPPSVRPPLPVLRWLLVWALLVLVYAAAGLLHRAMSGESGMSGGTGGAPGASWAAVDREDLVHLAIVPLVETGALALVLRLRRRP